MQKWASLNSGPRMIGSSGAGAGRCDGASGCASKPWLRRLVATWFPDAPSRGPQWEGRGLCGGGAAETCCDEASQPRAAPPPPRPPTMRSGYGPEINHAREIAPGPINPCQWTDRHALRRTPGPTPILRCAIQCGEGGDPLGARSIPQGAHRQIRIAPNAPMPSPALRRSDLSHPISANRQSAEQSASQRQSSSDQPPDTPWPGDR